MKSHLETLLKYQKDNEVEPVYIIDCIQYYLTELLKANIHDEFLVKKIYKDIEKTKNSKFNICGKRKDGKSRCRFNYRCQ